MTKSIYNTYFLVLILAVMSGAVRAQSLSLDWVKSNLTGGIDAQQMILDREGNIVIVGTLQGQTDFGFGADTNLISSNGGTDICILKFDASGIPIWIKTIGGTDSEGANSVAIDSLNEIYVTGFFKDTLNFNSVMDPELSIASSTGNVFLLKLTEQGEFEWVKSLYGESLQLNKIRISEAGDLYLTGHFQDSVDLDFGTNDHLVHADFSTTFLGKYDANFNLIWADTIGDYYNYSGIDVNFDNEGNIVYTSHKYAGMIIRKLSENGVIYWSRVFSGNITSNELTCDEENNVLLCGSFDGNVDFDPGPGSFIFSPYFYVENGFVLKLNESGNFTWASNVSGPGMDRCLGIVTDSSSNVYVSGLYQADVDFDPQPTVHLVGPVALSYLPDLFIWKLDSAGNFTTVKSFGGGDGDRSINILIDSSNSVYSFGQYGGFTNDFDPGSGVISFPYENGNYLIKFANCQPTTTTDTITACDSIQWLNGITYYSNSTNSGTYNFISSTSNGCDSIVELYLNVRYSSTNVDSVFSCDPYTWINGITYNYSTQAPTYHIQNSAGCDSANFLHLEVEYIPLGLMHSLTDNTITANATGLSYRWLDCNNGMSVIPNETSQSFTPTVNGSYAVEITKNGCIDTSACMLITTVGIDENTLSSQVTLYPNPAKGDFTLLFNQNQPYATISLFSITGQLTESWNIENMTSPSFKLDCPDGSYLVEILNQNNEKTFLKLIKN